MTSEMTRQGKGFRVKPLPMLGPLGGVVFKSKTHVFWLESQQSTSRLPSADPTPLMTSLMTSEHTLVRVRDIRTQFRKEPTLSHSLLTAEAFYQPLSFLLRCTNKSSFKGLVKMLQSAPLCGWETFGWPSCTWTAWNGNTWLLCALFLVKTCYQSW